MKILPIMVFSAALPLFVSCTQDDIVDDYSLPEELYPITISAVSLGAKSSVDTWGGASQTRASEFFGVDSDGNITSCNVSWEDGDKINVLVSGGGYDGETMVCTLDKDGNVTDYEPQLYYKDTSEVTLTAWYTTHDSIGTVDLSDQTEELAQMMTGTATASYKEQPVELVLKQSLLKIFVYFNGNWTVGSVTSVSIQSYTKCTHNNGVYAGNEGNVGEIKMMYCNNADKSKVETNENTTTFYSDYPEFFEANVCPNYVISSFKINEEDWEALPSSESDGTSWNSGELLKIDFNVKRDL